MAYTFAAKPTKHREVFRLLRGWQAAVKTKREHAYVQRTRLCTLYALMAGLDAFRVDSCLHTFGFVRGVFRALFVQAVSRPKLGLGPHG